VRVSNVGAFLLGLFLLLPASAPRTLPTGYLADYDLTQLVGGDTIANLSSDPDALPDFVLDCGVTDVTVSGGYIQWNAGYIDSYEPTELFPFDETNGTCATTGGGFPNVAGDFPNTFASGSYGVRLEIAAAQVTSLGQGSDIAVITFRRSPDVNEHSYGPRWLTLHRGSPGADLQIRAAEGQYSDPPGSFQDEAVSAGFISSTVNRDLTIIVVWDPDIVTLYLNGSQAAEKDPRTQPDNVGTPDQAIFFAAQPGLIHSEDQQFFVGAIKRFVVYDRVLDAGEIAALHADMAGGDPPRTFLKMIIRAALFLPPSWGRS